MVSTPSVLKSRKLPTAPGTPGTVTGTGTLLGGDPCGCSAALIWFAFWLFTLAASVEVTYRLRQSWRLGSGGPVPGAGAVGLFLQALTSLAIQPDGPRPDLVQSMTRLTVVGVTGG
jgi:hypothetical protein